MRTLIALAAMLVGCSVDTNAIGSGSVDVGIDSATGTDSATLPDSGPPDTAVDSAVDTAADTSTVVDGSAMDGGTDAGPADTGPADTGPADTGPADTGPADTGPPVGTVLFSRDADYDVIRDQFDGTSNIHWHNDEMHPDGCRSREILTLTDPMSATWANYEVSTRMRFDEVCDRETWATTFTMVARTTGRSATCADIEGYACTVDYDAQELFVSRTDASCGFVDERSRRSTGTLARSTWYDMSIRVVGGVVTCTFDNGTTTTVSYTDAPITHAMGGVGFLFQDVDVDVDNLAIIVR